MTKTVDDFLDEEQIQKMLTDLLRLSCNIVVRKHTELDPVGLLDL